MTSRREFVGGGLALSTLAILSPKGASAGPRLVDTKLAASVVAIADSAFVASAAFAHEVERHGLGVRGFDDDVGGLWLHVIEPQIARGRAAIVGLTGAGVLFCLETLARAHGFGAVFRAECPAAGAASWPKVAASYSLEAAFAAARSGGETLAPFEHHAAAHPAAHDSVARASEPRLLAWTLARDARRPALLPT
jgi:hypothetical protein